MARRRITGIALALLLALTISGAQALGTFPKVGEYEVLRGDFHMHTVNSDGKLTARERIDEAKERDLDVLAITDHGNFRAARFAMQYAQELGLVAIRGMETGFPDGTKYHVVALGFDPLLKPRDSHRWSTEPGGKTAYYQDEMRKVQAAGGLLFIAHPHPETMTDAMKWGVKQGIIQGMELHNTKTFIPRGFDWGLENNLTLFANSDAHRAAALPYTLVFAKQRSAQAVMDAIRARRTATLYETTFRGRQDMLSRLFAAMVKAREVKDGANNYLEIENLGPVALKGSVDGAQAIEIAEGSKTKIPWTGAKNVSIKWENAFVNSKDNLVTTHAVASP